MWLAAFLGFFPLPSVVLLHRFFKHFFMFRRWRNVLFSHKRMPLAQLTSEVWGLPSFLTKMTQIHLLGVCVSSRMAMVLGRVTVLGLPWCESCPTPMRVCLCQKITCSSRNLRNSVNEYTCYLAHLVFLFADCKIVFGISLGWRDSLVSWASWSYYPKDIQSLRGVAFSQRWR